MKKIFDSRIFDIVSSIIETIIAISLIILIVLVGFQRFSNRGNLFGYRIYTIASGSMIPTYVIGDTLLIKEMSSSNINVGDAVTYMGEAGGVDGMIITHQVQEVDIDENGKYSFHTKGIANNIEDPIVYEDQVLGKVVHKFFLLSIVGRVTTSMPLLFTFVTIPVAILIAIEIIKIVYKKNDDDDDEDEDDDEVTDSLIAEVEEDEDEEEVALEPAIEEVQEEPEIEPEEVVEDTSEEIEPKREVQMSNEEIINELREMGLRKEKVQEKIEEVPEEKTTEEEKKQSEEEVTQEENEEQKPKKKRKRKNHR